MLVKKYHFCNQLSGQLFKCNNCDGFPKIIRETRGINTDDLVNIELISQSNNICTVTYELEVQISFIDNTYDYITCGDCSHPLLTLFVNEKMGLA
jgi:hypothetical protein